ncbi:hypothetical protein BBF96_12280 [Anoxybacter fermentans]|uniref:VCBS repeat-containing protein n=1 Tax=Anoxybacter fermentans TaxID=1323375 RepID=A0A3S9T0H4_9FIRM|nr:hypothetical protein [Anoxybacter fermentans]AZR74106.1 hypothetical protein BBF96_12280 [Anoxybacter fermentans]
MNVKVSIILIVIVFIFAPSIYAVQLYSKPFWANSINGFEIGNYGDIKLLLTVGISKSPEELIPDSFNLKLHKISFGSIEPIEIDWIDMPEMLGEYPGLLSVFCDFNKDGKDEIFIVRTESSDACEVYVYKIFLEEKKIEKIWSEKFPGVVWDEIKLDEHNILVQVSNLVGDYLFILGYKNGQIIKKWEMRSSYGEYLESQFEVVDNSKIYIRVGENTWKKVQIVNDEIVFSTPLEDVSKESMETLNLDDDNELENIEQISNDNDIVGGVDSDNKSWLEEFDNNSDYEIWNLISADLDNDGLDEDIFLYGREDVDEKPYEVEIFMVKY